MCEFVCVRVLFVILFGGGSCCCYCGCDDRSHGEVWLGCARCVVCWVLFGGDGEVVVLRVLWIRKVRKGFRRCGGYDVFGFCNG